jgi:hypothetical protein
MTDWRAVDAALRTRTRGLCELCMLAEFALGRGRFHRHHLLGKGMGGTSEKDCDRADLLKLLHAACHGAVHHEPRLARKAGLLGSRLGTVRPSALLRIG